MSADRRQQPDRRLLSAGGRRKTDKIACPFCGCLQSSVMNSRPEQQGVGYWRRRECGGCGKRFTTEEVIRGTYAANDQDETSGPAKFTTRYR